jgi:microcystin-dependent protein
MASPNLIPGNTAANGDTFQYFLNLTNNLVSLANKAVYANGMPTDAGANVAITGDIYAQKITVTGNTASYRFYNDANLLVGSITHDATSDSIVIASSDANNTLRLYSNGAVTAAGTRLATTADVNAVSNSLTNAISSAANTAYSNAVSYANQVLPSGSITAFAGNTAPNSWFECDGSAKSRSTYSTLFAVIGTLYGAGDGSTTFNLPDLRGEFIRGWDHGRGVDSGRTLGSFQDESFKAHTHSGTTSSAGSHTHTATADVQGNHAHGVNDPGHAHSVSDPGHAHSISDPGHAHSYADRTFNGTVGNNGSGTGAASGQSTDLGRATSVNGTGIGINGAFTGIGIFGALTNISIQAAGAHSHNISVVAGGAHSHTFTTDTGAGSGSETRPRNVSMMYIIKA